MNAAARPIAKQIANDVRRDFQRIVISFLLCVTSAFSASLRFHSPQRRRERRGYAEKFNQIPQAFDL